MKSQQTTLRLPSGKIPFAAGVLRPRKRVIIHRNPQTGEVVVTHN